MNKLSIGFAMCGSFCTFSKSIEEMKKLKEKGHNIVPIMSFNAYKLDTKFGKAKDFISTIENICEKKIINTIQEAEPIGPKKMLDVLLISPCTGNTLAKLCNAVTDTPVTMAAKSHLRINRPVVISFASNDALSSSAKNLGKILNTKNIYLVPLRQDDPEKKPWSLVSHFELIEETMEKALRNIQIQPIFR
ncbi:MAG: dipicolinate synthase subunit B [Acutalibacteraceae bacterium]